MNPDQRFDSLIQYWAWYYHFDWQLIRKQIEVESSFNPDATSGAGAKGLAQFEDDTFNEWAKKLGIRNADPYNPDHSVHCQCAYLAWLLQHFGGDMATALAGYNWGPTRIDNGEHWPQSVTDYINKILGG